jgi:eukaryotic-like serine/threonine-protein kinase
MQQASQSKRPLFGAIAVQRGYVTRDQVKQALAAQEFLRNQGIVKKIGEILVDTAAMSEAEREAVLAAQGMSKRFPLKRLGNYEVLGLIGEGSFGAVLKARQMTLDRIVAMKVMSDEMARDPEFIERFRAEARNMALLNHPNIVSCIDVGEDQGYHYMVMEFVDGGSVWDLIKNRPPLDEADSLRIAADMARALIHAAEKGLVHRDIKPANILLTSSGQAKLADLGMAKLQRRSPAESFSEAGMMLGTPDYVAPEQITASRTVDARGDIYSLGATLYRMVTGRTPFGKGSVQVILAKHQTAEAPWPKDINPRLSVLCCSLLRKMMARAPEDRFQSAEALLEALDRVSRGMPYKGSLPLTGVSNIAAPTRKRRRAMPAAAHPADNLPSVPAGDALDSQSTAILPVPRQPSALRQPIVRENAERKERRSGRRPDRTLLIGAGVAALLIAGVITALAMSAGAPAEHRVIYLAEPGEWRPVGPSDRIEPLGDRVLRVSPGGAMATKGGDWRNFLFSAQVRAEPGAELAVRIPRGNGHGAPAVLRFLDEGRISYGTGDAAGGRVVGQPRGPWCDIEVLAVGCLIRVRIDGQQAVDAREDDLAPAGGIRFTAAARPAEIRNAKVELLP